MARADVASTLPRWVAEWAVNIVEPLNVFGCPPKGQNPIRMLHEETRKQHHRRELIPTSPRRHIIDMNSSPPLQEGSEDGREDGRPQDVHPSAGAPQGRESVREELRGETLQLGARQERGGGPGRQLDDVQALTARRVHALLEGRGCVPP